MSKIVKAFIEEVDYKNRIIVFYDDGTGSMFEYYPDELIFCSEEFLGLTKEEAIDLFNKKDMGLI